MKSQYKKITCIIIMMMAYFMTFWDNSVESAPPIPIEYQVKAAFLYKFIKFIDWPEDAFPTSNTIIKIGVLGKGPMVSALKHLNVKGTKTHKLKIDSLKEIPKEEFYHIVFIHSSRKRHIKEILAILENYNTLTISEIDGFPQLGGIINFTVARGRTVKFEINSDAAKSAGLRISSKLLRLAKIVKTSRSDTEG